MGNRENHGKTIGKPWQMVKTIKKHGKTMVKWEYHRETWGSSWEFIADL